MWRKWNDSRGETLVEVLASVLICSLSVVLLFSMVMASGNMDQRAEAADQIFNESLAKAEGQLDTSEAGGAIVPPGSQVMVKNTDPAVAVEAIPPVTFYGGRGALSYALPQGDPA